MPHRPVDRQPRARGSRARLSWPVPARAARWGIGGFVFGAMLWCLVGQWELPATHLLPTPPEPPAGCTALVIDPSTGQTKAEPCLMDPA
jgi:hypothetical protein